VFRWFDETMLDCCTPIEEIEVKGITLPKLACLARCNGALVMIFPLTYPQLIFSQTKLHHATEIPIDEFRDLIKNSCRQDLNSGNGSVVIVSYARKILNQTGTGHFSPVGGYHETKDLVLILDVARFKVFSIAVITTLSTFVVSSSLGSSLTSL
jgi:glutathione gamma-glutamylcysteinyltransferase